jgi:hypothetical protein
MRVLKSEKKDANDINCQKIFPFLCRIKCKEMDNKQKCHQRGGQEQKTHQ